MYLAKGIILENLADYESYCFINTSDKSLQEVLF